MSELAVLLERSQSGSWSAFVLDLPGCTAAGSRPEEALAAVRTSTQIFGLRKLGFRASLFRLLCRKPARLCGRIKQSGPKATEFGPDADPCVFNGK
jgi:hypothetical protein